MSNSEYKKKRDESFRDREFQEKLQTSGHYFAFVEGSDFGREYQKGVEQEILKVCEENTQFMWAAKIIGIILDCDFRNAKQALEAYNKSKDVK